MLLGYEPWTRAAQHRNAVIQLLVRLAPRSLEILPTATVWLIITAPVWGALFAPVWLGFGMLLFSVYWLWKSTSFALGVGIGFWRLQRAELRDWLADAQPQPGF